MNYNFYLFCTFAPNHNTLINILHVYYIISALKAEKLTNNWGYLLFIILILGNYRAISAFSAFKMPRLEN